MSKTKSTANDAQLKARRTSLEKKNYDELINIILRKDSTERKNNVKIQELTSLLREADELNEEKATRILGFEKDMKGMEDLSKAKQEQIDNLISEKNGYCKEVFRLKELCNLRRKVIFTLFGVIVIAILIVLFFILG